MEERESLAIRFLYGTALGRMCLKALVRPGFSQHMAKLLNASVSRVLIRPYIRRHHILMDGYERKNYRCFNDFFTRRRKQEALRIDMEPSHLISPCDSLLTAYPITQDRRFTIKRCTYSLEELLRDRLLAQRYTGGLCLIFRLTPHHYHRYCYIDDGRKGENFSVPGVLHSVRPMCCGTEPVYVQNQREYTVMDTVHFGKVIQVEVGALMVGRIRNAQGPGRIVRGQEKGYFEFGGSTIILLLEPGVVKLEEQILRRTARGQEYPVRQGQQIGQALGWIGEEREA